MSPKNKNPRAGGTAAGAQDTTPIPNDSTASLPHAARRALARYESRGCHFCRHGGGFYILGTIGTRWRAACGTHADRLHEQHFTGLVVTGDGGLIETAATPWGTEDRAWFDAHLDRSHRVREVISGEFPEGAPGGYVGHVVVRQYTPGFRQRLGFAWGHLLDEPPEAWCHALFDVIADCHTRNDFQTLLIGEEITALSRSYTPSEVMQ